MTQFTYLYKITNVLSSKIYIGQTVNPSRRWNDHKWLSKNKPEQYIHYAMAKYDTSNFTFEIIATCRSSSDANEIEAILINQYDSRNSKIGYNIAPGGVTPWNLGLPKELNPLTGIPRTKEVKKKISEGNIGKIMPPCSEEQKNKMSNLYKGRTLSKEWVEKIALGNKGKKRSDEVKQKLSISHIGIQAGEKHPKAKLTWDIVNQIRQEYATDNFSQRELASKYNISQANIADIIGNKIWKS